MRKTIYIAIMFTLMVSTGCEDYLGIKPRGYDVAYKIEHYEGLIYGAEPFMLDETFPYMCFEYTTDRDGYESVYSNLEEALLVRKGDNVKKGDVIARVGDTALFETVAETHLHFEMINESNYVNPLDYFSLN